MMARSQRGTPSVGKNQPASSRHALKRHEDDAGERIIAPAATAMGAAKAPPNRRLPSRRHRMAAPKVIVLSNHFALKAGDTGAINLASGHFRTRCEMYRLILISRRKMLCERQTDKLLILADD